MCCIIKNLRNYDRNLIKDRASFSTNHFCQKIVLKHLVSGSVCVTFPTSAIFSHISHSSGHLSVDYASTSIIKDRLFKGLNQYNSEFPVELI